MSKLQSFFQPALSNASSDKAAFVLRISLGLVLVSHALLKIFVFGLNGSAAYFSSVGLPAWLIYPVIALELFGGALIALGLWVRLLASASAVLLLGTVYVHAPNGWLFSSANGGWEYPLFLTLTSIAVALSGEGAYALRIPAAQPTDGSPAESVIPVSFS